MTWRFLVCAAAAVLATACGKKAEQPEEAFAAQRAAADNEQDRMIAEIRGEDNHPGAFAGDPNYPAANYGDDENFPAENFGNMEHDRRMREEGSGRRIIPGGPVDFGRLPQGAIVLSKATINDPGVIRPGPALTALIPAGWTTSGGVVRPQGACADAFAVNWSARSPDGSSAIIIFPTEVWNWSNSLSAGPCRQAAYSNVREYLADAVASAFPGARVIDYRERPDFARSAAEEARRTEAMARQVGLDWRVRAEGGEVLFAFQQNGADMRGVAGVSAIFYGSQLANPMGGEPLTSVTGATLGTFGAYARNGALNFDLVEASRRSITPDPQWLEQFFSMKAAIGAENARATKERAALIVAGGAEATRQNIAAYQQMAQNSVQNSRDSIAASQAGIDAARTREPYPGSNAQDRMQRESIEAIRGVETYHDPIDNSRVQLDMNYDHAWRVNGSESYILTKDPNFNPGQYGIEATQMGVVR